MKQVFLHIGTHKTGTTSFQSLLVSHAEHLRAHGVEPYLETRGGQIDGNCFALAHDILRADVITGSRYQGRLPKPGLARLIRTAIHVRRFLAATGARKVVFSAEAFSFLREPAEWLRLRLVFGFSGIIIVPLVVFRDEADWRASWNDQIAKNPKLGPHMQEPGFPLLRDWWFDKAAIVRFWSRGGNLRIIDYDEQMARHGDILPALLAELGVPRLPAMAYRTNPRTTRS